jgi:hypothetical protein
VLSGVAQRARRLEASGYLSPRREKREVRGLGRGLPTCPLYASVLNCLCHLCQGRTFCEEGVQSHGSPGDDWAAKDAQSIVRDM